MVLSHKIRIVYTQTTEQNFSLCLVNEFVMELSLSQVAKPLIIHAVVSDSLKVTKRRQYETAISVSSS